MASYLKSLSPVPRFPEYTGPYKVGTVDVELPAAELDASSLPPRDAPDTVLFRVFYPCEVELKPSKHTSWLPSPQRAHVAAYTKFMGAGSMLAEVIAFFPHLLYYINIPARKNAPVLAPTTSERWPVMVLSHGLGGSRNVYSHLAGSIASHGIIVVCPEHRDGSAPVTFVRDVPKYSEQGEKLVVSKNRRTIGYTRIPHTPSPEVEEGRTAQLKMRLWELCCIHEALVKIDEGMPVKNLNSSSLSFLSQFYNKLAVHEPGSITFAGHSFGAATMIQLVKSTYYAPENHDAPASYEPLFVPTSRSAMAHQITPNTPLVLLDAWLMPIRAAKSRWLWNKPLPCYAPGGPGGCAILAVESQAFYKWRVHLKATKNLLSPNPGSESCSIDDGGRPGPHFYYATASAHLSQSDFGILFPWFTRKVFASEEPERVMKLNVRAVLQLLRERHIPIAATSMADMELGPETEAITEDDSKIFCTEGEIRGWNYLSTDASDLSDVVLEEDSGVDVAAKPGEAVAGGELMKGMQGTGEPLKGKRFAPAPAPASAAATAIAAAVAA